MHSFRLRLSCRHDPSPQNLGNNLQLVDSLNSIATRKGITLAQLSIAWVGALGDHVVPLPGSS